jgi:TPR repeat protein
MTGENTHLHLSLYYFEQAFQKQHHVIYIHPEWLYQYATALDILGDQAEDETYYTKAIDILNHILIIDPQFPEIHQKLAVIYSHLAELQGEKDSFIKSLFHFQVAAKNDNENDVLLLDWALTLTNFSEITEDSFKTEQLLLEAEYKLFQAAKLGNIHAYYHLAGIFALKGDETKAMQFMAKAKELEALPSFDELLEDSWLENIKNSEAFRLFLDDLDHSYKTRRSAS